MTRRLGVAAALVGGAVVPGDVAVDGGRISAVGVSPAGARGLAVAGLVDVQVNGYAGVDLAAADLDGIARVRRAIAADGVTAFVPTLITGAHEATVAAIARLGAAGGAAAGARLLPAHLEGPFLSPVQLGTHPAAHRRDPDSATVDALLAAGPVGSVTLAPELPGALDVIATLVERGIVVLVGHSDATAAQARAAFDIGATGVTHLWNAMRPLHHRDPGLVGAALARLGVVVGLIVDGHHVAPEIVRTTFAAAAGRTALVTDATAASGMPDGDYVLGDVAVRLRGGAVRNAAGGLAGSAATLAGCVREAVAAGVDELTAWHAATAVPAALLRRPELGRLRVGGPADVTVFDDGLQVRAVLVAGEDAR